MSHWAKREAYRIDKSRTLLRPTLPEQSGGIWADVGCGDGIFTSALHTLLTADQTIYGVDKNERALQALQRNFAESYPAANLQTIRADFTRPLSLPPLDGLLLANSLHFVREKQPVLAHLTALLKPTGRLIIVEYNTNRGNYAVPYPFDEDAFVELAESVGLSRAWIAAKVPSRFLGEMYAGVAMRKALGSLNGA